MSVDVRPVRADDWRAFREMRLEALREAPYAYSSTLAEWQGDGDTEERWRRRLTDVPFNVIAELDGVPAGIVSATAPTPEGSVRLISMWVAPFARGRGIGDALVDAVLDWSRSLSAARVTLDVFPTNTRAIALYRRHSFADVGIVNGELSMAAPL